MGCVIPLATIVSGALFPDVSELFEEPPFSMFVFCFPGADAGVFLFERAFPFQFLSCVLTSCQSRNDDY